MIDFTIQKKYYLTAALWGLNVSLFLVGILLAFWSRNVYSHKIVFIIAAHVSCILSLWSLVSMNQVLFRLSIFTHGLVALIFFAMGSMLFFQGFSGKTASGYSGFVWSMGLYAIIIGLLFIANVYTLLRIERKFQPLVMGQVLWREIFVFLFGTFLPFVAYSM